MLSAVFGEVTNPMREDFTFRHKEKIRMLFAIIMGLVGAELAYLGIRAAVNNGKSNKAYTGTTIGEITDVREGNRDSEVGI